MRRRLKRLGVALLFVVAFGAICYFAVPPLAARLLPIAWLEDLSQRPAKSSRWKELVTWAENSILIRAKARERRIKAELATLRDHPWAGQYGKFLLAPQGGFVYWPFDHFGPSFQMPKYGTIQVLDDHRLRFTSALRKNDYPSGIHYVFAHRGDQWFVPEWAMPQLCAQWNACGELIAVFGALTRRRPSDEVRPDANMETTLTLPPPYDAMALSEPIEATVVGIEFEPLTPESVALGDPEGDHRVFLYLDVGSETGVWPGLRFLKVDQPEFNCVLMEAVEVGVGRSRCKTNIRLERDDFATLQGPDYMVLVGVRVSTCAYDDIWHCCFEQIE
ncbi:MAG: hypothetical protein IH986_05130 [Planctomycetes bacterium]|nr:hypothetical protein [Planctomycetota bacterium]